MKPPILIDSERYEPSVSLSTRNPLLQKDVLQWMRQGKYNWRNIKINAKALLSIFPEKKKKDPNAWSSQSREYYKWSEERKEERGTSLNACVLESTLHTPCLKAIQNQSHFQWTKIKQHQKKKKIGKRKQHRVSILPWNITAKKSGREQLSNAMSQKAETLYSPDTKLAKRIYKQNSKSWVDLTRVLAFELWKASLVHTKGIICSGWC